MNYSLKPIKPSAFKRLKKMGKRMAIARDVLQRIEAKNLVPTQFQKFFRVNAYIDPLLGRGKEVINSNSCEVCAKGAILCSFIGNFNKYKMDDLRFDMVRKYPEEVLEIFDRTMLDAMEIAFESANNIYGNTTDSSICYKLKTTFNQSYSHDRLVAIMNNLIANRGKLVCVDGTVIQ